ncbi:hypothetical protein ANCCAN_22823 [Ancylostoma caninum]|uniref:AB hydrolase-1 domain-containing protein n=1 Tax=Ancylostoma caninum TaxID=29170 RepID=A0A368FMH8_ANCCA|nr:hypothetical protein ANCCAN_22823 [Ancylostoma caninum]
MKNSRAIGSVLVRAVRPSATYPKLSRSTTVVLFGWAMARDENLAKYSQIYEKEGLSTLRFISPFSGHTRSLKYSRDVSGVVENLRAVLAPADARLVLHLFSMNAIYTLCALNLQYPELDVLGRTDAIIFDSCPVLFDATSPQSFITLANTLAKALLQNASVVDKIKFHLWKTYFQVGVRVFILEQAIRTMLGMRLSDFTPYHYLRDHPQLPRLMCFIYSDRDFICPPRTIQQFHEDMAQSGKQVDVLRLTDSDHVEHFKKYPAEYSAVVQRFLSSLERL